MTKDFLWKTFDYMPLTSVYSENNQKEVLHKTANVLDIWKELRVRDLESAERLYESY